MRAAQRSVHIDVCLIVHRTAVQHHATRRLLIAKRKVPPIPHSPHEIGFADAGELALRAERHRDHTVKRRRRLKQPAFSAAVGIVNLKFPLAVQVLPGFPAKLRLRMFFSIHFIASTAYSIPVYLRRFNAFFYCKVDISY